ncbi:hypothetical protein [Brucella intermedia]|uniref:hypothetical protein n=1 Tax=Brucella intermedia TaxID=94625 RepID=UPI00224A7E90|nr:hypothetical protein [Brucella intermedia]
MLDAKAFIALETTQSAVMRAGWRKEAARHIKALEPMLAQGQWDYAHEYVDKITMNGVVGNHFARLEELAVSSILFGAQNVTQDLKKTSFVTGSAEIPYGMQQALEQMNFMIERDGAELLRKELHAIIRQEEIEFREAIAKSGKQTLYVHRPLLNAVQLIAWARLNGFKTAVPPEEMHVTVCYSKTPIDWGDPGFSTPGVRASGGKRTIERFGKAIVLTFESQDLHDDHERFEDSGASWDHPSYRPHVTISYDENQEIDISKIEPFTFDLEFGPEVFAPVKEDWSSDIKEIRLNKAANLSLAEKLNNAVMGKGGKIIDIGANLTTSRLVSLGFLAEAIDAEIDTYQVNEVLDELTCPVCRYMHGKTFRVENEFSRTMNVLSTTDPKELKGLAPWPLQTKAGLKSLYAMSIGDMQNAGYGSPPYHPGCRGYLSLTGTVTEEFPIGSLMITEAVLPEKPKVTPKPAKPATPWLEKPTGWLDVINRIKDQSKREAALQAWSDENYDLVRELIVEAGLSV